MARTAEVLEAVACPEGELGSDRRLKELENALEWARQEHTFYFTLTRNGSWQLISDNDRIRLISKAKFRKVKIDVIEALAGDFLDSEERRRKGLEDDEQIIGRHEHWRLNQCWSRMIFHATRKLKNELNEQLGVERFSHSVANATGGVIARVYKQKYTALLSVPKSKRELVKAVHGCNVSTLNMQWDAARELPESDYGSMSGDFYWPDIFLQNNTIKRGKNGALGFVGNMVTNSYGYDQMDKCSGIVASALERILTQHLLKPVSKALGISARRAFEGGGLPEMILSRLQQALSEERLAKELLKSLGGPISSRRVLNSISKQCCGGSDFLALDRSIVVMLLRRARSSMSRDMWRGPVEVTDLVKKRKYASEGLHLDSKKRGIARFVLACLITYWKQHNGSVSLKASLHSKKMLDQIASLMETDRRSLVQHMSWR